MTKKNQQENQQLSENKENQAAEMRMRIKVIQKLLIQ